MVAQKDLLGDVDFCNRAWLRLAVARKNNRISRLASSVKIEPRSIYMLATRSFLNITENRYIENTDKFKRYGGAYADFFNTTTLKYFSEYLSLVLRDFNFDFSNDVPATTQTQLKKSIQENARLIYISATKNNEYHYFNKLDKQFPYSTTRIVSNLDAIRNTLHASDENLNLGDQIAYHIPTKLSVKRKIKKQSRLEILKLQLSANKKCTLTLKKEIEKINIETPMINEKLNELKNEHKLHLFNNPNFSVKDFMHYTNLTKQNKITIKNNTSKILNLEQERKHIEKEINLSISSKQEIEQGRNI